MVAQLARSAASRLKPEPPEPGNHVRRAFGTRSEELHPPRNRPAELHESLVADQTHALDSAERAVLPRPGVPHLVSASRQRVHRERLDEHQVRRANDARPRRLRFAAVRRPPSRSIERAPDPVATTAHEEGWTRSASTPLGLRSDEAQDAVRLDEVHSNGRRVGEAQTQRQDGCPNPLDGERVRNEVPEVRCLAVSVTGML